MSTGRVLRVGLITNNVYGNTNYEQNLWDGACQAAEEENVSLITFVGQQLSLRSDGQLDYSFLYDIARQSDLDGLFVNAGTLGGNVGPTQIKDFLESLQPKPVITIAVEDKNGLYVGIDNKSGMRGMIRHLIENLGAKRIAYLSGPYTNGEALDRLAAYKEVLAEHGIPADEKLIIEGTWVPPSGVKAVGHLIDNHIEFDALAAANDMMAVDALNELRKRGIDVPRQCPVSGFDDVSDAIFCSPKLSTVSQPIRTLGYTAIKHLAKHLRNESVERHYLVPAQLVLRGSAPLGLTAEKAADTSLYGETGGTDNLAKFTDTLRSIQAKSADNPLLQSMTKNWLQASQGNQTAWGADWGQAIIHAAPRELEDAQRSLAVIRASIDSELKTFTGWRNAIETLHRVESGIVEQRSVQVYLDKQKSDNMMSMLVFINAALNTAGSFQGIRDIFASTMKSSGVSTAHLVLFEEGSETLDRATMLVSLVDGTIVPQSPNQGFFKARELVDGDQLSRGSRSWLLFPLMFEHKKIGYIIYEKSDTMSFVYDTLANQFASVIHGIRLITHIEISEDAAAGKTRRITELVKPMLDTIRSTEVLAREQGAAMSNLAEANVETSKRLSATESHVAGMRDDLQKIMNLTATIDNLSETINVIAINAAIAAARAGSNGKVFSVIASEIRQLSVQTKTNTQEIGTFLKHLDGSATSFFQSNEQTRDVFKQLESETARLMKSLGSIQDSMTEMTGKAGLVLDTMSEKN